MTTTSWTVALDLDGVLWLADQPIPGAAEAVHRLRAAGLGILFVSNNSAVPTDRFLTRFTGMGIEAHADEVLSSSLAAADLLARDLPAGARVLVCGEDGVEEALTARGLEVVDRWPCEAVVVGITRRFDYDLLERSSTAVRNGARFVATNLDATFPSPRGLIPGNGALVAAVATASGFEPEVAGKPYPAMVELILGRATNGIVIGDRPSTDGALADALGWPFGLVLSEVITRPGGESVPEPPPALVGSSLAELVDGIVELAER